MKCLFALLLTCGACFGQVTFEIVPEVRINSGATTPGDPSTFANPIFNYDITKQSPSVGAFVNLVDQSANHFDAIRGGAPYATNNAAELRGTNFWVVANGSSQYWKTNFASISQPCTIYLRARMRAVTGNSFYYFDSVTGTRFLFDLNNPLPAINAGTAVTGGSQLLAQWYWIEVQFNGASSFIKTNDVLVASGNCGTGAFNGLNVAVNQAQTIFGQLDLAGMWGFSVAEPSSTSTAAYQWNTNRFGP